VAKHAAGLPPELRERFEAFGHGLLNKFLHAPTTGLKRLGERGEAERASYYANELFGLGNAEGQRSPDRTGSDAEPAAPPRPAD
jgi:glutamyl-tRNA reductase